VGPQAIRGVLRKDTNPLLPAAFGGTPVDAADKSEMSFIAAQGRLAQCPALD